jgi:hypothetical protein
LGLHLLEPQKVFVLCHNADFGVGKAPRCHAKKESTMSSLTAKFTTLAVLVIVFAQIAGGQSQPSEQSTLTNLDNKLAEEKFSGWTVEALLNRRDTLNKQITDLSNQIGWIQDAIAKRVDKAQFEAKHKSTEAIDDQIAVLLGNAGIPGAPLTELDTRLAQHKALLEEAQNQMAAVDKELTRRLDLERPKQTFKLEMSAVFAALVAIVILGFFVMAYRDEQVRREIFAGQAGIQFVTLFSLVIAIILFGIIDILQGKELAALLGGLSGYILGRATPTGGFRKGEAGSPAEPQPEGQPEPGTGLKVVNK